MGEYNDSFMRNQNAAVQARTKAQNRSNVLQLKLVRLITDQESGKRRGYAFIEYVHKRDMKELVHPGGQSRSEEPGMLVMESETGKNQMSGQGIKKEIEPSLVAAEKIGGIEIEIGRRIKIEREREKDRDRDHDRDRARVRDRDGDREQDRDRLRDRERRWRVSEP